jgi:hypothetical protein
MLWVIDESGEKRDVTGLRTEFFQGLKLSQEECLDYAVKNLGYAVIRRRRSGIELSWRPEIITDITLAGIFYEVGDFAEYALAARWFQGTEWRFRVLPADYCARIEAIGSLVRTERSRMRDRVVYKRIKQEDLNSHDVFAPLIMRWKASHASGATRFDEDLRAQLDFKSSGKFCLVRILSDNASANSTLMLDEVGRGFPKLVLDFLAPIVGRPIVRHKDEGYGNYVLETYFEAANSGVPSGHDVDAILETVDFGRMRRRYKRLILPFRDDGGWPLMASVSVPDSKIDLRS